MNLTGNSERPSTPSPRYASAPPPSAPATSSSLPIAVTEPENARRASDTCRVTHFGASECVRAAPRQPHPHPRHRLPPVSSPACPAPRLASRLASASVARHCPKASPFPFSLREFDRLKSAREVGCVLPSVSQLLSSAKTASTLFCVFGVAVRVGE